MKLSDFNFKDTELRWIRTAIKVYNAQSITINGVTYALTREDSTQQGIKKA